MRTFLRHRQRASLAHASAVLALLIVSGLALAACGIGETASGTTPPAASPSPTDTYVEITPSPAPSHSPSASGASTADFTVERAVRLTGEADNPTFLDVPGTAPLAQTEAVARRYGTALNTRAMVDAGLYAVDATRDLEGGVTRGAKTIERYWYDAYHEDPDVIAVRQWSKDYHLLVAPGIAVYEGARLNNDPDDDWRWYLALLAVDGDQITHEEVYFGGNGLEDKWPMAFCQTAPGPGDTAEVAAQVAAAVGQAFATRDRAALEALLAPDVIFPEIEDRPGVSGREALLDWWAMLAPPAVSRIVVKDETPMAGPGWAVLRFTARRWMDTFPRGGVLVSANVATVIEVRGGKVVRIAPYGTAEMGTSGLMPPREGP